ncbi:phosphatidylserine decarboxylase-domain-containing protein [Globomyces pollinis-pini]|nr:phosphatidylserine decarboxylase-domain-containing protein [Globomyces pollinis-pini]
MISLARFTTTCLHHFLLAVLFWQLKNFIKFIFPSFIMLSKRLSFRFLQRISRIEPNPIQYHTVRTPLSLRRSFISHSNDNTSLFSQAKAAWNGTKTTWYQIPVSLGIAYIAFYQLYKASKRESTPLPSVHVQVEGPLYIRLYASLPLRYLSQLWGQLNDIVLPVFLRIPVYKTYSWLFGCHLDEMVETDLTKFENLGQFFYREIRPEVRSIADTKSAALVSPADGKVLHCGKVVHDEIEQVKGVTYSLDALLGKNPANLNADESLPTSYIPSTGKSLFFCVIYLSPGDYHRYHSPTEWKIDLLRHFAGEMFSVSPWLVEKLRHLFALNERVSLLGHWQHGMFAMVPVAATNVGKIILNFAPKLFTNVPHEELHVPLGVAVEEELSESIGKPLRFNRGEEMGGFKLGSTIVMVFEAPDSFKFDIEGGQKIKLGEAIGQV